MDFDNLIFLHIPKAAGSTLHAVLDRHYPKKAKHTIQDDVKSRVSSFRQLPLAERSEIRLLKGHFPYGMHDSLVGKSTYITLLRNPVERIVSHYYFVKRTSHHYLYNKVISERLSLFEYINSGMSTELDNGQVRLLSGVDDSIAYGACERRHLDLAKQHIEQEFAVAGLSEHFDASLILMRAVLGWKWFPYYRDLNVTEGRPKLRYIDDKVLSVISETNRFDVELYEWVTERFMKSADQYRIQLSEGLRNLSRVNRIYQPLMATVDKAMHAVRLARVR